MSEFNCQVHCDFDDDEGNPRCSEVFFKIKSVYGAILKVCSRAWDKCPKKLWEVVND